MTQVFENGTVRVFENPNASPRAWMVHEAQQLPKDEVLPALQSGQIDPKQTVLVEQTPPAMAAATGAPETVTFTTYKPDEMSMRVTANSDGMLVLSEVYAPGWNAYVDGKKAEIYAADYALRGIPVPAGEHTVTLRYELQSLSIGLGISVLAGLGVLIIFGALAWDLWRRRNSSQSAAGPSAPSMSDMPPRSDAEFTSSESS